MNTKMELQKTGGSLLILILAFGSLLVGGFIYILWRPETIIFIRWLDTYGWGAPLDFFQMFGNKYYHLVPAWVVFSLPNGLWAFSYTIIILHLWWNHNSPVKYFWFISIPVVGMGYETMQYLKVIPGTFCVEDLTLCAAGIMLGIATICFVGGRPIEI